MRDHRGIPRTGDTPIENRYKERVEDYVRDYRDRHEAEGRATITERTHHRADKIVTEKKQDTQEIDS